MAVYVPTHFALDRADALAIVDARPLATLVTTELDTVEVPLLAAGPDHDRLSVLVGHVAAAGPFAALAERGGGVEALAVHRGEQGYVTPSWYAQKVEHGRVVPTWDYSAVRSRGVLTVSRDPADTEAAVRLLTTRMETPRAAPWSVDDAPRAFVERQLRAIVALRLEVTAVDAAAKLSQNRPEADVVGVVAGLRSEGHEALAADVERHAAGADSHAERNG